MDYFKSKAGNTFYGKGVLISVKFLEIILYTKSFDNDLHVESTKEEFQKAFEEVVNKLIDKVYGSK